MYLLTITSVFLSTPSARRATFVPSRLLWEHFEFLSTPSARRATGFGAQTPSGGYDFYPRPPRGGRQDSETNGFRIIKFLSTPSARRATRTRRQMVSGSSNFYPRPPRGGRPSTPGFATLSYNFYPRPPRGGRQDSETNGFRIIKFLSTPSARRATTRPPRPRRWHSISIHALREEGDPDAPRLTEMRKLFLSTPSARRATHPPVGGGDVEGISIHALREEGDVRKGRKMQWYGSFLSTPSARRATGHRGHGERCRVFLSTPSARRATFKRDYSLLTTIFLSTPSARRATTTMWTNSSQASISIHALREEGDSSNFASFTSR